MNKPLVLKLASLDPLASFTAFKDDEFALLLDSAGQSGPLARYSFICAEPVDIFTGSNNPFPLLKTQHLARKTAHAMGPFDSGLAGFLAYEAGRHLEKLPQAKHDPLAVPDYSFALFESVITFDHALNEISITGPKAKHLADRLMSAPGLAELPPVDGGFRAYQTQAEFTDAIAQTRQLIAMGDIFQANITQGFLGEITDSFAAYRHLRQQAPGPFSGYLRHKDLQIASVSPERFLSAQNTTLEARPIKGTAKRNTDPAIDQKLAQELVNSAKDRAENLMILDLMRNDLARVSDIGSIKAPQRMALESFARVHHLVSVVQGQLRSDLTPIDALAACFPPGSITGAPKIRAQEIIAQLEPLRRGAYCGAMGYISDNGNMDFSVLIRTLAVHRQKASLYAGGGITWDSNELDEFEESMLKAGPLLRALGGLR